MRRRLQLLVSLIVVVLLGGVGFLVGRSLWEQRKHALLPFALEIIPGVSQHIQDFHRVKIQNGQKVWEVAAQDAQYFDETNLVAVRRVLLQWHLTDGRIVGLQCESGTIHLDGRDVQRIELSGDIHVSLADYEVRVASATYDHEQQRISAPGAVEIVGQAMNLHGTGMEVDVQAQRLTLLHEVSMQLDPARVPQGGDHATL